MSSRPSLSAVPEQSQAATPSVRPNPRQTMVQLNVSIPVSLRKAARLKALQEEREIASVVRELLEGWVGDDATREDTNV